MIRYIKEHKCPRCHKIKLTVKSNILLKPAYFSCGRVEEARICRYCGFSDKKTINIMPLTRYKSGGGGSSGSTSSFGSSGSHSSSSSNGFGGGYSGGGGSSGRW